MPAGRQEAVDEVATRLSRGERVLVVGEPGSGRTTVAFDAAALAGLSALRGTGLRLVRQPRLTLNIALREETSTPAEGELLVVDDVQWADEESLGAIADHEGPLLLTGLTGTAVPGTHTVALGPLPDGEAVALLPSGVTDLDSALRRAGGNPSLLRGLEPGSPPSGRALRTLRTMLDELDATQREHTLLLGAAGGPLPLPLPPDGLVEQVGDQVRLRIGALSELLVAAQTPADLAAAHRRVADLLADPARRAPHLAAAGDAEAARSVALSAVQEGGLPPEQLIALLRLAEPLPDQLADLLAVTLWSCWDLDGLLEHCAVPTTPTQQRLVVLARASRGEVALGHAPQGAQARAALAAGTLAAARVPVDHDDALALAASALARGEGLSTVHGSEPAEPDDEQRWQAAALMALAAALQGRRVPVPDLNGRGKALLEVLGAALVLQSEGASSVGVDRLAAALDKVTEPVPAWGQAALALAHAELGNAPDAALCLERAQPTSAFDRQLLRIVRAECELATGRPRRALQELDAAPFWPALAEHAEILRGWARRTVGEPSAGDPDRALHPAARAELRALRSAEPDDFRTAAAGWQGICARRALQCRWAAAADDVNALRELESVALDTDLLPLLSRVREAMRRAGARPVRTAPRGEGAAGLSPREREVLHLVRDGLTSAQAATRLGVAQSTVETQIATVMRKLGARTRRHAVALYEQASP